MHASLLRKLRKCDPKELLCWISYCQLPPVNRERAAFIEYILGFLVSLDFRKKPRKRKISRKLINRTFLEAAKDFEEYLDTSQRSKMEIFFPLGFLSIRGEAFPWQFEQAALDRYGSHERWMAEKLGFTIFDAVDFSKAIMRCMIRKALNLNSPSFPPFSQEQYYNPRYVMVPSKESLRYWIGQIVFSRRELESLVSSNKHEKLSSYLDRMSIDICKHQTVPKIKSPLDFNIFYKRPLVRIDEEFILVCPRILWPALSTTFHYDLLHDKAYRGKYVDEKGKIAERRVMRCFRKLFQSDQIQSRVKYDKHGGWPDLDLLIHGKDTILFVECTAKWITRRAKKGDIESIMEDLRSSIQKCSRQLTRALNFYLKRKTRETESKRLLPVIVVDDYIPGLDFILQFCDVLQEPRPYIINTYELDIITDLTTTESLTDFISRRIQLSEQARIFSADEIDYFVLYKLHGFKEYAKMLEKGDSTLHYIGHLENLFPMYYKKHFLSFLDDSDLASELNERTGWEVGWS